MAKNSIVEVSFVFRGKDALENADAFMLHIDTIDGLYQIVDGIRHFGGRITNVIDDTEQKMLILDGDMGDIDIEDGDDNV